MNLSIIHNNGPLSMVSSFYRQTQQRNNSGTLDPNLPSTLSIYNAMTGTKLITHSYSFKNLEALKQYIGQSFKTDNDNLFLLTPFGIKLKFNMIIHEEVNEIYAFDRNFFNPGMVDSEQEPKLSEDLMNKLTTEELISMIKPRESPIYNAELEKYVLDLEELIKNSNGNFKSTSLDFEGLRLLLNSLKRNSGWASALLSDFKSTLFDDTLQDDYEEVENILKSLNVLIQYVNLLFKNLEKDFNESIDNFILLHSNSLSEKWQDHYKLLQKLYFSFKDRSVGKTEKLELSDLIDKEISNESANASKALIKTINENFITLKAKIEEDIILPKQDIVKEYDVYRKKYLKSDYKAIENEMLVNAKNIFFKLEEQIVQMNNETKKFPLFEELIITTNQTSSVLSQSSLSKILLLIEIYKSQIQKYVPFITSLSGELHQVQIKCFDVRESLQRKIVKTTLINIIKIQLNIRQSSKLLINDINKNLDLMKQMELQLSVILDLPLIFGIWSIAILGNIKHGMSLNKLIIKVNEIFEMMNFMEKKNRTKWLEEFTKGIGSDKVKSLFLDDANYKHMMINDNLMAFKLVPIDAKLQNKQIDKNLHSTLNSKKNSLDSLNYLTPLNKLIQNINGFPLRPQQEDKKTEDKEKNGFGDFFTAFISNVTINDILRYIQCLEDANFSPDMLTQLTNYLKDIGVDETQRIATKTEKGDLIVKDGNMDRFGTFDSKDKHFLKLLKKFIKGFEIEGIVIDVKLKTDEVDISASEDLIKGYESRIRKLENLLHQKNFRQFNDRWSQREPRAPISPVAIEDGNADNIDNIEDKILFKSNTELGRKQIGLPPSHYSEKIENLTRENGILKEQVRELKNSQLGVEVGKLKEDLCDKNNEIEALNSSLLESNQMVKEKNYLIEQLQNELQTLKESNNIIKKENTDVVLEIEELKGLNKDLLENMSHKENEFKSENQLNQKETNELKLKIEDLAEAEIHLEEVNNKLVTSLHENNEFINNMCTVVEFLRKKLKCMSQILFQDMVKFCLLLESMGLLLVREESADGSVGKLAIKRVKGLRNKKKELLQNGDTSHSSVNILNSFTEELNNDESFDTSILKVVACDVIEASKKKLEWIGELEPNYDETLNKAGVVFGNKAESEEIFDNAEKTLEFSINPLIKNFVDSYTQDEFELKFEDFINFTVVQSDLLVEKVFGRFNDVESLARRLQKEKNQQKGEIKTIKSQLNHRLVLRNFKVGDLVLFLKTLIPSNRDEIDRETTYSLDNSDTNIDSNKQPWAIFNIGSPNYYLRNRKGDNFIDLKERDWFVGRITEVVAKTVSEKNFESLEENPFNLNKGSTWYFVEAKEEKNALG